MNRQEYAREYYRKNKVKCKAWHDKYIEKKNMKENAKRLMDLKNVLDNSRNKTIYEKVFNI